MPHLKASRTWVLLRKLIMILWETNWQIKTREHHKRETRNYLRARCFMDRSRVVRPLAQVGSWTESEPRKKSKALLRISLLKKRVFKTQRGNWMGNSKMVCSEIHRCPQRKIKRLTNTNLRLMKSLAEPLDSITSTKAKKALYLALVRRVLTACLVYWTTLVVARRRRSWWSNRKSSMTRRRQKKRLPSSQNYTQRGRARKMNQRELSNSSSRNRTNSSVNNRSGLYQFCE